MNNKFAFVTSNDRVLANYQTGIEGEEVAQLNVGDKVRITIETIVEQVDGYVSDPNCPDFVGLGYGTFEKPGGGTSYYTVELPDEPAEDTTITVERIEEAQ